MVSSIPTARRKMAILTTLVAWTSPVAIVVLLLQEGWELIDRPLLRGAITATAIIAVALSVLRDVLRLRAAERPLRELRQIAPETLLLVPILVGIGAPALWALAVGLRQVIVLVRVIAASTRYRRYMDALQARPAVVLVLSFAAIIAVGTLLLSFPRATTDGKGAALVDAVFTSTSATCVTGLATLNTVDDVHAAPEKQTFTRFGQLVLLLLIQIGGLGIMTLSAAMVVLAGKRLTLKSAGMMQSLLDETSTSALRAAVRDIFVMTFTIEAIGAVVLFARFWQLGGDAGEAAWQGLFHSVSAFCNAGFSLFGDSLASFAGDVTLNFVHAVLITLGGIGFGVITMLVARRTWERGASGVWLRLSLQVRLVVVISLALTLAGTISYYFLEFDHSLAGMPLGDKLVASFFQSVSFRTAGFNTVDLAAMSHAMLVLSCFLMFVGASPGSCGGGVKTTTVGVLFMAIRSSLRGGRDVEIGRQTVSPVVVNRAVSIVAMAVIFVITGVVALAATQTHIPLRELVFESFSALGTVGLSIGATAKLTAVGKVIVVILMFIGRLGPLTIALAVGERRQAAAFRYPEGRVVVG